MHRLVFATSSPQAALGVAARRTVVLSSSSSRRGTCTIRPLHPLSRRTEVGPSGSVIRRQRITTTTQPFQKCRFSTDITSGGAEKVEVQAELSQLSHRDLEQLALKYARQGNPTEAQRVLDWLVEASQKASNGGGGGGIDDSSLRPSQQVLENIRASVVDAWFEYQRKQIQTLEEYCTMRPDDNGDRDINFVRNRLKEICHAAESASALVEPELAQPIVDENNVSPHHVLVILKAWANACEAARMAGLASKSGEWSGIPQRAQHIMSTYLGLSKTSNNSVELVNQVLKAWAYSGEHLRGTMAEQVYDQFLKGKKKQEAVSLPAPNGASFRYIIRAWSWSKEKRCAFTATGHFMRMMRLLEFGSSDMEPTLEEYRILFQAWTTAEDKNSPSKVHLVLQIADSVFRKGLTEVRPDLECYRFALEAMARRVNVPEVGDLVDQTLSEMKRERMIIPNTECYGAAILAWKHVAMGRECEDREGAVLRAYDLLKEMIEAFHRTTTVIVKPTIEQYNHVLEALTMSKLPRATQRAEKVLFALEKVADRAATAEHEDPSEPKSNYFDKHLELVPDADSYKHTLMVWRNSKSYNKVQEAQAVVKRFESRAHLFRNTSTDNAMVEVMNAFISVCARAGSGSKDEARNMETMFTALRTMEGIRAMELTPNSTTYAALLEACDTLVHDGQDRQRILENIFGRACEEGYVDHLVLKNFKAAASAYLYTKLVVASSQKLEQMEVVPESWTRHVQGFSANTKGGRSILPLTVEGKFTFTKAAADYKMRKLKKRANRKMLQGGRMK